MNYTEIYPELNKVFASLDTKTEFDGTEIHKFTFHSQNFGLLPGNLDYLCETHDVGFPSGKTFFKDIGVIEDSIHIQDYKVEENRSFHYYILKPCGLTDVSKVIFLFHGFNEKNWNKYLPWAKIISEKTQRAIVLFPIAFHMDRARASWSEKREMFRLSEKRKERFPNIIHSTLSNVAISMRLHSMPQRFIWSGLQTYFDVIQFIEECRKGEHPLINKDFKFDIFAYSIGGLLAEILKLSDHKGYFSESKVCLFCGGAVFNRLSPVSKFILDSEASVALYSYLVEHFESYLKKDSRIHHYIKENHIEGRVFHAMLDYKIMRDFREGLLKKMEKQFYAISLKKDFVVPSYEVINTLRGAFRDIDIKVDEFDFEYPYTHENPFPLSKQDAQLVNDTFNEVFGKISDFYLK
jgi:hypothetical protein